VNTDTAYQYPEPIKGIHTVEFFRKIKTRISRKISGMTYEELRAYLDKTCKAYDAKHTV
jgi:Fe-S cluster assembly ATPase SufC